MAMSIAIYPGSFDPLTNGHLDIIRRASRTFERVIVSISDNQQKDHTFPRDQRIELVKDCVAGIAGVEVDTFKGLLVKYAEEKGVKTIVRGLRAFSDFEYEFQLATMNAKLNGGIETVFMMTSEPNFYLSSRLVREVASLKGNVKDMVPAPIYDALQQRYG